MSSFQIVTETTAIAVLATSAATPLPTLPGGLTGWQNAVSLYNSGTTAVYVALGGSAIIAAIPAAGSSAQGYPIPAGATVTLNAGGAGYIATIAAATGNTLYVTAGVDQA